MAKVDVKINKGKIEELIKALNGQKAVKVGLLAGKGGDDVISEDMDLAGIGAVQEFGATIEITPKMRAYLHYNGLHLKKDKTTINIPARSFLKLPLEDRKRLLKNITKNIDFDELMEYIEKTGDLESLAIMIGAGAVETINEAFESEGFGQWQPDNPYTTERKGSGRPLQDTGKLKKSISYEVTNG